MTPTYTTKMFDSLDALADAAERPSSYRCNDDAWAGGSLREAIRRTRDGDLGLVVQSDALLEKFESLSLPTLRREWYNEVAGHVANVPAFLAGHPQAMRRRRRVDADQAPVTLFVDVFASCGFSKGEILARGAAVLALARVLAAHRALSLYVAFGCTPRRGAAGVAVAVRIDTSPLDLAHAAYALASPLFLRQVMFHVTEQIAPGSDPFPPLSGRHIGPLALEMLGAGTQIVTVPGVVSDVTRDPGAWIEARIRECAPEVLGEVA